MPNDTTTTTDGLSSPRSPELQVGLDLIAEATAVHRRMVELLAEAPPEVHEQVIEQVRPMLEANVRRWRELVEDFASGRRQEPRQEMWRSRRSMTHDDSVWLHGGQRVQRVD